MNSLSENAWNKPIKALRTLVTYLVKTWAYRFLWILSFRYTNVFELCIINESQSQMLQYYRLVNFYLPASFRRMHNFHSLWSLNFYNVVYRPSGAYFLYMCKFQIITFKMMEEISAISESEEDKLGVIKYWLDRNLLKTMVICTDLASWVVRFFNIDYLFLATLYQLRNHLGSMEMVITKYIFTKRGRGFAMALPNIRFTVE